MASGRSGNGDWRQGLSTVTQQQAYMLDHSIHTDCTFTVGPEHGEIQVFQAHKFVLIRASSVFEAMLLSKMREVSGEVRVTDLRPSTFQQMLRHMYTDEVSLHSCDEGFELALAADKYLLLPLREKCLTYVQANMGAANVWRALQLAQLLHHQPLHHACVKVIQWHTLACLIAEDFLSISEESLLLLLEQDCLNVNSELQLIEASVSWSRHEAERRGLPAKDSSIREILQPNLLGKLRFLALKPEDFANGPAVSGWLTDTEKSSILVNLISPGKVNVVECISSNAKPRISLLKLASDDTKSSTIVKSVPNGVFICNRSIVSSGNSFFNSGTFRSTLIVKTDRDIWMFGLKLSSQLKSDSLLKNNPKNFTISNETKNCYCENINFKISELRPDSQNIYLVTNSLCKGEFSCNVDYNSQICINFNKKIYLEKNKHYYIDIQFRKIGYYPSTSRSNYVRFGNVDFEFASSLGIPSANQNNGAIEAVVFTAEDLHNTFRVHDPQYSPRNAHLSTSIN